MPVVFAPPEPVAPSISSAYGAAQQWSQDFPTLERQQQGIVSANEQARALTQQGQIAAAGRQQQALEQSAHNTLQAETFNQSQEQQQRQFIAARQPSERDVFQANAQMAEQQQRAELQSWLGQQDLSQKETMRLQQMKGAVADIEASSLPDEQKQAAIVQLRTGIDGYKVRQQAALTRDLEAQAKQREQLTISAAKTAMDSEKVAAMSAQERNKPVYSERILNQVAAEVQDLQQQGLLGPMTPQERDQFIKDEAAERDGGLLGHEHRLGAGKSEFIAHTKTDAGKGTAGKGVEKPFDTSKTVKDAQAEAELRVPILSKEEETSDRLAKRADEAGKIFNEHKAAWETSQPSAQPKREAFGGRFKPKPPPTTEEHSKVENVAGVVQQSRDELEARQDVPPEVKQQMLTAFGVAQQMLDAVGGDPKKLPESQKKMIEQFGRAYQALGKGTVPPAPTGMPPPAQGEMRARIESLKEQPIVGPIARSAPDLGKAQRLLERNQETLRNTIPDTAKARRLLQPLLDSLRESIK